MCLWYIYTDFPIISEFLVVFSRTRLYTYGQPRTGNLAFAELVNGELGPDAFRGELVLLPHVSEVTNFHQSGPHQ
jgi:hypothetical protein